MIKHPAKVFFLSVLMIIFISNKGMQTKDLVNMENSSPKLSSEASVPYGSFEGWFYTQTYFIKNSKRIYGANCLAKDCSETFEASTKSLVNKVLIEHLEEHLQNATDSIIAEKKIFLTCSNPIFSIKIELPTALWCKDSQGTYYSYKCNECKTVQGRKDEAIKLKSDAKQHIFSCCKVKIKKIIDNNQQKTLRPCCLLAPKFYLHIWKCHFKIEGKQN